MEPSGVGEGFHPTADGRCQALGRQPTPRGNNPSSGRSNVIVYDLGSDLTITVSSASFHLGTVTPTFLLPGTLDNRIVLDMDANAMVEAAEASFSTPTFALVPPITFIPAFCITIDLGILGKIDECFPEIRYPGLIVPSAEAGFGPLLQEDVVGLAISDDTLFDRTSQPWVLGGFNTVTDTAFGLDAEIQTIASLTGPAVLNESQEGTFIGGGIEPDFGEFLTFSWTYGDGIADFGDKVMLL